MTRTSPLASHIRIELNSIAHLHLVTPASLLMASPITRLVASSVRGVKLPAIPRLASTLSPSRLAPPFARAPSTLGQRVYSTREQAARDRDAVGVSLAITPSGFQRCCGSFVTEHSLQHGEPESYSYSPEEASTFTLSPRSGRSRRGGLRSSRAPSLVCYVPNDIYPHSINKSARR